LYGKILIVKKSDGQVLGWFGEGVFDISEVELVQLEPKQNEEDFIGIPVENIKVIDKDNRILYFEPVTPEPE
jgi:hypothetical protein